MELWLFDVVLAIGWLSFPVFISLSDVIVEER
jgi:hypothetical protein